MKYRPFSNNKIVSYNDYIKNKTFGSKYSMLTHYNKVLVVSCKPEYPCLQSPINLIQGKTSYICDPNKNNIDFCTSIKPVLYPYGFYLCKNEPCDNSNINNLINNGSGNGGGVGSGNGGVGSGNGSGNGNGNGSGNGNGNGGVGSGNGGGVGGGGREEECGCF